MQRLGDVAARISSKNAGPFWITIDIRCGDAARFDAISAALSTAAVAARCGVPQDALRRFDIPALGVIKLSLQRAVPQGALADRDMHGAQHAMLLAEMEIALPTLMT